ncbi:AGL090Wp [Eremothecium gossypii ATCC 10895]|uniref:AGL090Wp n=1 Tax=Eremothecium gossypii (strain ATCC 10895 / CBS 109.51 / FGSC 9923 / NRRL Y-1056) TaxID=284811 RepID=Q750P0_EREGS|nr:AGL090Wp [Eremothecium gossypii ATCC 10895]AAS54400.1 AGL090Wp [Eremothecium gossypii ATCC 10895]AEY98728.1 FAGL090Wp [Eremothecium gossypii FDAG1]
MVVHNPNNWHWVDKNCIDWAKKHFAEKLAGLSSGNKTDGEYAEIAAVNSVEGDCEVNQRKGKVISLFDLRVVLSVRGHVADGTDWEGSITIPEVAFDSAEDDYQFEISIYQETSKLAPARPLVREKLVPQLRAAFAVFGKELLQAHGKDIQVPQDQVRSSFTKANQESSFVGTDATAAAPGARMASAPAASAPRATAAPAYAKAAVSNTTSIHIEPTFNVAAADLFHTLLDKQRITAWSRSHIQADRNGPELAVGETARMFGGNVTSTLLEAHEPERLVFNWRLADWSPAQVSKLAITFHESPEFHETKMVVSWSGIPIGEEEKVKANFEEMYVRAIKLTFGFGSVL